MESQFRRQKTTDPHTVEENMVDDDRLSVLASSQVKDNEFVNNTATGLLSLCHL